ncbi:MAG: hypothetical protein PVG99_06220 [Desulfobacteraceae bacterium]
MSDREYLSSLLREAAVYRNQGFLAESRGKYAEILEYVGRSGELSHQKKFIQAVQEKMRDVERDLAEISQEIPKPELSEEQQSLIKELFTFANSKEAAAIQGAVALAEFGQYDQAVEEFRRLLKQGNLPLMAAKNILRCYLSLSLPGAAIAEFTEWISSGYLSTQDLKYIRGFLENVLRKRGIDAKIPDPEQGFPVLTHHASEPEDFLEISAINIQFRDGSLKGHSVELDVNSQLGSAISVVVSSDPKELADSFRLGKRLSDIQFYSSISVFRGSGIVSRKKKIEQGPRRGDYRVDITIDGD